MYGQDGQRSNKYTERAETLYFNKMWTHRIDSGNRTYGGQTAKNIYLGETRIVTKLNSGENPAYQEEYYKRYYYHSDHLGSASLISDYKGDEYQRIEYTPYGETWVEKTNPEANLNYLPYKFTAKELDEETGLYYYGARYLDPKYSRWISTDPALGDYIPQAPINEEARKHNQNLPGMGGVFNHINGNCYHYAANNPIRYTDPTGKSGEDSNTLESSIQITEIQNNRPLQPFMQTSPELGDIPNMRLAGCNLMTYLLGVQNDMGVNLTSDEIHDLVNELQNTPNPANPSEMCLLSDMEVRNPDVAMNRAFDILGAPNRTGTAGYGAEPGQQPDFTNISGTTPRGGPHHQLGDTAGNLITDPWGNVIQLRNTHTVNIYFHGSR